LKKAYLSPAIINAHILQNKGITPLAVGAALVGLYAIGRVATQAMKAVPSVKLPNLKPFGGVDSDICLA